MDDLDRLAFRLVRTVRSSYPHLLSQGFTLTDLEERLVPFRDARREMSNNGPEAWEVTVLRMVSGERGYLSTDADLQLACRQALRLPSPTIALVRPWSTTTVTLGDAAKQLGNERAQTPSQQFDESVLGDFSSHSLRIATPTLPRTASVSAAAPRPVIHSAPPLTGLGHVPNTVPHALPLRSLNGSAINELTAMNASNSVTPVVALPKCGCRFCGGKLPDTRKLVFCPHCGVNLTVRHCPACSTELDVNWRFCVTCGRGADVPEMPASVARMSM
jgi:hypothetical protein